MKRLFALFTALLILVGFSVQIYARPQLAEASAPNVSAKSAILINGEDGEIYYRKNADAPMGMASTTKLMTAIVALSMCDPDKVIAVPYEAVGTEGSSVYLVEGERLTLRELLCALLLSSANDAAVAIAVSLSGDIESFADEMNAYAKKLGLTRTHFTNPHGLYDEAHYTTARELAAIAREALKYPLIEEIVCSQKATIPHSGEADKRLLVNHNRLLKSYDGAIGMKTGFTKKTGRCLVSAARRGGLTLIAVTLNAPDDWRDHTALLDYGFENYEHRLLYSTGEFSYSLPLSDSSLERVALVNTQPLAICVKKGDEDVRITVEAPARFAVGEVKKGQIFGTVTVFASGKAVSSPLAFAEDSRGKTLPKKGFFERILTFFSTD